MRKKLIIIYSIFLIILVYIIFLKVNQNTFDVEDVIGNFGLKSIVYSNSFGKYLIGYEANGSIVVIKISNNGNIIWAKSFGNDELPVTAGKVGENILLVSNINDRKNDFFKGKLMLIDFEGNISWVYTYEKGFFTDYIYEENEDEIILTGINSNSIPYVLRIGRDGKLIDEVFYKNESSMTNTGIAMNKDGYFLFSKDENEDTGQLNYFIVKVDKNLQDEWNIKYNFRESYQVYDSEDGYVILGETGNKGLLQFINRQGNVVLNQEYDDLKFSTIYELAEGGYIVGGSNRDNYNAVVVKIDEEGEIKWERTYNMDLIYSVKRLDNGDFLFLSNKQLLRTNSQGVIIWLKEYKYKDILEYIK